MKHILSSFFALAFCASAIAQQKPDGQWLVNSAGYFFQSGNMTIEFSIGEVAIHTLDLASGYITQGVVQPEELAVFDCSSAVSLGADTTLKLGDSLVLSIGASAAAFQWNTGSTAPQITVSPQSYTKYAVTVTGADGCTASDEIAISLYGIPTNGQSDVFTPDGDGKNDTFIIEELKKDLNCCPGNEFIVFNRWGDRVFYDFEYENKWDGRNQSGEELPQGTYYYLILLDKSRAEEQRRGTVLIVR